MQVAVRPVDRDLGTGSGGQASAVRHNLECVDWELLLEGAAQCGSTTIRVWNAACSSGADSHALAILAIEAFAPEPAPVSILGTDVSTAALTRAQSGRYAGHSVSDVGDAPRERYYRPEGDELVVESDLQSIVRSSRHDLVRDPAPPAGEKPFDLIVCGNALESLDAPSIERLITSLERALRPHGAMLLEGNPLDADAYLARGLAELDLDDPSAAVASLSRALYVEPTFGLAAFSLGRAHDGLGDEVAAERAYERTLRIIDSGRCRPAELVDQPDTGELAAACRARIDAMGPARRRHRRSRAQAPPGTG